MSILSDLLSFCSFGDRLSALFFPLSFGLIFVFCAKVGAGCPLRKSYFVPPLDSAAMFLARKELLFSMKACFALPPLSDSGIFPFLPHTLMISTFFLFP